MPASPRLLRQHRPISEEQDSQHGLDPTALGRLHCPHADRFDCGDGFGLLYSGGVGTAYVVAGAVPLRYGLWVVL